MSQSITTSETLASISNTGTTYSSITVSSGVTLSIASEADNAINNSSPFSNFSTGTGVVINDNGGFENNTWGSTTLNGDGSLSIGATNTEALNNSNSGHILVGSGETITDAGGLDNSNGGALSLAGNGTLSIGNTSQNAFDNYTNDGYLTGNYTPGGYISIGTGEIILDQGGLDNVGGTIVLSGAGSLSISNTDPNNAINNSGGGTIIAETGEVITDKGGFNNYGDELELSGSHVKIAQNFNNNQGYIAISNGSTLAVGAFTGEAIYSNNYYPNTSGTIAFYGNGNVLSYATLGSGLGTVASFGNGDIIDLTGTDYTSTDSLISNGTIVSLVDGTNTLTNFSTVAGEKFYLTQGSLGEIEITNGSAPPSSGNGITSTQTLASINNVGSIINIGNNTYLSISSFPNDTSINNSEGGSFTAGSGVIIFDNGGFDNASSNLSLTGNGTLALGETDSFALNNNGGSVTVGNGEIIIDQGGLDNENYGYISLAGNGTLSALGTDAGNTNAGINNSNNGTIIASSGETIIAPGGLNNGGLFNLVGATATIGSEFIQNSMLQNASTATISLEDGSTLISVYGLESGSGTFAFQGSDNILDLGPIPSIGAAQSIGTVTGFGTGDVIELTGSTYNSTDSLVVSGTVVSVVGTITQDGYPPTTETFANFSTVTGESFTLIDGANGEIEIICFLAGTHIATPQGEVEVQNLRAGDMVLTAQGEAKPIRWLGRSTISPRFADPLRAAPIRITAGALADNLPVRDLLVSPAHAMFIDGVLVQAGALVNGTSIRRERMSEDRFTYYHVELESHELIRAEGAACESFIDNVDRMNFDNWAERETPEPMVEMAYPRAKSARQVPTTLRQQLAARAALTAPATAA